MTSAGRILLVLWIGLLAFACATPAEAATPFAARFTANQPGDITIVGNTVLTCPTNTPNPTNNQNCIDTRSGAINTFDNNSFAMQRVDIDGDPGTVTSSSATLQMPANATVLFAGLYWFGSGTTATSTPPRDKVKLRPPGATGYTTLDAEPIDSTGYVNFADVTDIVGAAGSGVYTVADVAAAVGGNQFGGWSLAVAYGDASQPPRNMKIYDGLVQAVGAAPINVTGFTTPPSGQVRTKLGAVASDGDRTGGGDFMGLDPTPATTAGNVLMTDPKNPSNNVFNSTISTLGVDVGGRNPNYDHQLGIDIDMFNADGILTNGSSSAAIRIGSGGDFVGLFVVTFATELYAPVVQPTKTVANVTHPGQAARPGDTLRYTLGFTNTGQDAADDFVVTDPIPAGAAYKPGTLRITGGPNAPASPSDAAGDDLGEFDAGQNAVRFRPGAAGTLAQGASVAMTFDVVVDAAAQDGQVISNRGSSSYRARTLGTQFANQLTPPADITVRPTDLTLSKTHAPAFLAGGVTTFTLVASNIGTAPTDGTQVTVTDTFPGGASGFDSIANAAGEGWSCQISGLELMCTRSDVLPAGESYPPIFVDARVHDPAAQTIVNTARVAGGGDTSEGNNVATDSGGASAQADVQVTKRTTTPTVRSGGTVEWVVDVHNAGPSTAANVALSDSLPGADYADVAAEATQGSCSAVVSCNLGSIVPGGTATVTISARVLANATTLTNSATATSPTTDPVPTNNTGEASAVVLNTADLSVVKDGGPAAPATNVPYTYTVTVVNGGPGTATDVVVTDQLPDTLESPVVNAGAGWSCDAPGTGGVLTCTRASLAVGTAPAIEITGTIASAAGATLFENSAEVDASSTDPDPTNNRSTKTEVATPAADLAVTKTFSTDDPVLPTANPTVALEVTNNGPSTANNVHLEDTFPVGLVPQTVDNASCGIAGQVVSCDFATLGDGDSVTVTVGVDITSAGNQTLQNTATVTSATGDPITTNNSASDSLTVTPSADVSIAKSASPQSVAVGGQVTYVLEAANAGPSPATGVRVTDDLPDGTAFVGASAGCTEADGVVTCVPAGGALAVDGTATFAITVTVTAARAGQQVDNTAQISATSPHDPDPTNNRSTAAIDVDPLADLELTKTAADDTPAVDADDTFTLTVENHGPNGAEDVTIEDEVPAGMTFVAARQDCRLRDETVTCDVGDLPDGGTASRTITLRAGREQAGRQFINAAVVASATADPVAANNRDEATVSVGERVDLALEKRVTPGSVAAGGIATYTLVVTNDGPSAATGVRLTDQVPAGLEIASAVPSQGTCSAALECALGTIAAGAGAQVVLNVRPSDSLADEAVENTATVEAEQPDARPQDNTDTAVLEVTERPDPPDPREQEADLEVTKTVDEDSVRVGGSLHYRITVENDGNGTARDVVVTDTFSGAVDLVEASASQGSCSGVSPITCRLGDIAAGGSGTVRITARPRGSGTLTNTATAVSPDDPSPAGDRLDEAEAEVLPARARVTVRKRASTARVAAGRTVRFTLTVRSHGPGAARNVRVCDALPRGLQFVRARGASFRAGSACWRLGSLPTGSVRRLRVVTRAARMPATRRVRNVATVRAAGARTARGRATVRVMAAPGRTGGVTG